MSVAGSDRARRLVDRIAVRWGVLELIDDLDIEDAVLRIEEVVSAEVAERVGEARAALEEVHPTVQLHVWQRGGYVPRRALDGIEKALAALATAGAPGSQEDARG